MFQGFLGNFTSYGKLACFVMSLNSCLYLAISPDIQLEKAKKPVDKAVDNKFKEALEPINEKLDNVNADIKKLDKNQCMNFYYYILNRYVFTFNPIKFFGKNTKQISNKSCYY